MPGRRRGLLVRLRPPQARGQARRPRVSSGTSLAKADSSSLHLVSHPVITIESDDRAVGSWALSDTVIDRSKQTVLRGAAYYRDEYVRTDDGWRIRSTGYDRLYELRDPLN